MSDTIRITWELALWCDVIMMKVYVYTHQHKSENSCRSKSAVGNHPHRYHCHPFDMATNSSYPLTSRELTTKHNTTNNKQYPTYYSPY